MSASVSSSPHEVIATSQLQAQLRDEVWHHLRERQLDDPEPLGAELGLLPIAADGLLRRREWSVETALWIIERLDLPIRVEVRTGRS